jgi:phosphohistidine phosphatase
MKTLFVVRHAKSSWDFPTLPDHDRPLNKRGEKNAPEMGTRLAKRQITPDLMISSTAVRAQSTAQIIAEKIGYPASDIIFTRQLYHAGISDIVDLLANESGTTASIMLFGHNPGFTDFVNWLTGTYIDNVPTTGIVAIELAIEDWKSVKEGAGKILFFDYPKKKTGL